MEDHFRVDAYSPSEMAERVEIVGVAKAEMAFWPTMALSVLAGTFIAFGAQFYTIVTANSGLSYSLEKLTGGLAFSLVHRFINSVTYFMVYAVISPNRVGQGHRPDQIGQTGEGACPTCIIANFHGWLR